MATIASAAHTAETPQADGRRWIVADLAASNGEKVQLRFLADPDADVAAQVNALAAGWLEQRAQAEVAANVEAVLRDGSAAVIGQAFATLAQTRAALRAALRDASRADALMALDYLNSLTGPQLQALLGISAGAVTTMRTGILAPAATAAAAIRRAAGL